MISAVLACSRWWHAESAASTRPSTAYGGEDWEWAHRAWTAGGLLAHEPGAVAWHDGPDRAARAGSDPTVGAADRVALAAETLAVGRRVGVGGLRPRGLWLGAPEVVVTTAPGLDPEHLLISVDSVLQGLPHARVLLRERDADPARPAGRLLGQMLADPRVEVVADPDRSGPADRAPWRIRLETGVRAPAAAWGALLDRLRGPAAAGRVLLTDPDGVPLVTASARRAVLRAARWSREDLFEVQEYADPDVEPLGPRHTLQAHVGGWG